MTERQGELEEKIVRLVRQKRLHVPDIVRAFDPDYKESEVRRAVMSLVNGPLWLDYDRYIAVRPAGES